MPRAVSIDPGLCLTNEHTSSNKETYKVEFKRLMNNLLATFSLHFMRALVKWPGSHAWAEKREPGTQFVHA